MNHRTSSDDTLLARVSRARDLALVNAEVEAKNEFHGLSQGSYGEARAYGNVIEWLKRGAA